MTQTIDFKILLGILLLICSGFYISDDDYIWIGTYDGKSGDSFTYAKEDVFSNIVVLGNTDAIKYRESNLIFEIYSESGDLVDNFTYGGVKNEYGYGFLFDKEMNKIVAGAYGDKKLSPWITSIDENHEMNWELIIDRNLGRFNGLVSYEENYLAYGNYGQSPILYSFDSNGKELSKVTFDSSGDLVDVLVLNEKIYCLVNNCIDCYDSRNPEVSLYAYENETLSFIRSINIEYLQIGRQILEYNEKITIVGELFVPKKGIEAGVLMVNKDDLTTESNVAAGNNWDEEINGAAVDKKNNLIIYGRSLSDSDSRKKMEVYSGWSITLDSNLEVTDEYFLKRNSYFNFNHYISSYSGANIYIGAVDDKPGIVNRKSDAIKKSDSGSIKLKVLEEVDDIALDINQKESKIVFSVENPSEIELSNIEFDLSNSGTLELEIPNKYRIENITPGESIVLSIPFQTFDPNGLDFNTILISSNQLEEVVDVTISISEVKAVNIESQLKSEILDIDTNNLLVGLELELDLSNSGNLDLLGGKYVLSASSGIFLGNLGAPFVLSIDNIEKIQFNAMVSPDALLAHSYISLQVFDQSGDIVESNTVLPFTVNEAQTLQNEVDQIIQIKNELSKRTRVDNIALLEPVDTGEISAERNLISISENNLAKVELKNAYQHIKTMDIDWNYSIGRKNKLSNPKQRIMLTIEGYHESVDSVSVLINGERKLLDINDAEMVTEEENLVLIFEWFQVFEEGETKLLSVLHVKEDEIIKGEPIYFEYKEKKNNLYLVSIGIPDHFSDESTRLKYTSKDANDLIEFFSGDNIIDDYKEIHPFILTTPEETTKASILKVFTEIEILNPGPDDILLCYFSTHAFPDDEDLYIAPSDYDFRATYSSAINFTAFINEYIRRRECKKILLLDVCHSGAVLGAKDTEDGVDKTDQINDYMVGTLNKISNLYFVSSSKAGEYSYEIESLKNSAFMAAIKNMGNPSNASICSEMAREIDLDSDKVVNFTEMTNYLKKTVSCIVQQEREAKQNPKASSMGNDDFKIFDLN